MTVEIPGGLGKPLVTFALFAYNQEQYIREAVAGAFAQSYEPLEIILSDDCSTDRTFEIMQEMAAAYSGPHNVLVRRNPINTGTVDHFLGVAKLARGELLVVAAGDDVSSADRTSELAAAWRATRAAALFSGCWDIEDDGSVVGSPVVPEPLQRVQDMFAGCKSPRTYNGKIRHIPGYSAAYDAQLFKELPLAGIPILNEDTLMSCVVNLKGLHIEFVRKPLLKRRRSITSVSAFDVRTFDDAVRYEGVISRYARAKVDFCEYFSKLELECDDRELSLLKQHLRSRNSYFTAVAKFWRVPWYERLRMLASARHRDELAFILPRLLGKRVFCRLKVRLRRRALDARIGFEG